MKFDPLYILFGVDISAEDMESCISSIDIDMGVDESDLMDCIIARVDKLSNLVNEKYKFVDADERDLTAHLAMRMTAAVDESGRIETWFLNNESAALRLNLAYMRNNDLDAFFGVIKRLMFCDNVMYLDDFCFYHMNGDEMTLSKELGVAIGKSHLVMDWHAVPNIIRDSDCIIYDGYAVVDVKSSSLISQATKNFELLLTRKVYGLTTGITVNKIDYYSKFVDILLKIIRKTSTAFVGIENLEEEVMFFPPCIAALDSRLSQGFHMEHYEYLQLGFFLREAGMSFKDYQRYWYFRHPSNRGKSWEEFSTSHWGDYQLRQQYGLTGGGTQYSAFSCKKAQSEAFCPFKDFNSDEIALFIQSYLEIDDANENDIKRINDGIRKIRGLMRKRYFGAACATEYELRFKEKTEWVNHPIFSYYKNAKLLDRRRKKTTLQEDDKPSNDQDDRTITRS